MTQKIAPTTLEELKEYVESHGLEASITKFNLKSESTGLEQFGIKRNDVVTIQLTLTCNNKEVK